MKFRLYSIVAAMIFMSSNLLAQHNDVEFGYDDTSNPTDFVIQPLGFSNVTSEGFILVQSSMQILDPFAPTDYAGNQPGFATHEAVGLSINPGDGIMINALDASTFSSFGVGYVNFYNPTTDALEAAGRIQFEDNTGATNHLILNGDSIESGDNPQFIGLAGTTTNGNGFLHDHITWDLLDDDTAPNGAYGLLVQLQSDFAPFDNNVALSSDPFWIVFNHGMSQSDFLNVALPSFGVVAVPEPSSVLFLGVTACVFGFRRRRRE